MLRAAAVVLAAVVVGGCDGEASAPGTSVEPTGLTPAAVALPAESEAASAVVAAANAFIDELTAEQRAAAVLELGDSRRANWSNLPPGSVRFERNGVRIGDLDLEQIDAMHHFLALALSPDGYRTVLGIVRAEDALAESRASDRTRWSSDNYWLAFFGEPSESGAWGVAVRRPSPGRERDVGERTELPVADVPGNRAVVLCVRRVHRCAPRSVRGGRSCTDQGS